MASKRARISFICIAALVMVLFNVRYCQEVQTAERARFDGWVGLLDQEPLPSKIQIEYRTANGVKTIVAQDAEAKARAVRLIQVLKEAQIVGRLARVGADRSVTIKIGDQEAYSGVFSDEEAKNSPQLQVFARLISEFAQ